MKPTVFSQFLIAVLAAALVFGAFQMIKGPSKNVIIEHVDGTPAKNTVFTLNENGEAVPLDFTGVAEKSLGAVVHILSVSGTSGRPSQEDLLREFFGQRRSPRVGSGSGVIINPDGYIVTNNHVIQGADDLEVTLHDKRTYKATLVGTDPQTDIAVIKIEEKGLQSLHFTNSDQVRIGQWVLAIGNPFNLNSTVTAGIVSAKGRSIEIFDRSVGGIESFIQTDAAINPGNSGGALIDLNGSLIGINTAIASQTGTYSGYGCRSREPGKPGGFRPDPVWKPAARLSRGADPECRWQPGQTTKSEDHGRRFHRFGDGKRRGPESRPQSQRRGGFHQ